MSEFSSDRRRVLGAAAGLGVAWALPGCATTRSVPEFDLVIHGGTLVDGTGAAPRRADVGLRGDTIAAVGTLDPERGRRVLDARGLHVAPGFVDMHSHSDRSIRELPTGESRVLQGYTCEITGNCGGSAAPRGVEGGEGGQRLAVSAYLDEVERARPSLHHALLVGHGTLRENEVGLVDRAVTEAELARMGRALDRALAEGAFGLSSGLEYVPGTFTPPAELQALARVAARRGRLYATHMRNEDETFLEAVDEALDVARQTGVRLQVSHIKAAGRHNWHKQDAALARLENARGAGLDVFGDAYPYTAYSTTLTILFEGWAREGGHERLVERLQDPALLPRLRSELLASVDNEPGGFDLIQISSRLTEPNRAFVGKTIQDIASAWGLEPVEALMRLVVEEKGEVSFIGHAMDAGNVARVLAHPLVMVGSDGSIMKPGHGRAEGANPHPRNYGTAARVLGHFCRDLQALDLASAVRKLSAMPAERAGLSERGRIARGLKADLVLFDFARVADRATFTDSQQHPAGIVHVLVDGIPVVRDGQHTGERPGRVLRA